MLPFITQQKSHSFSMATQYSINSHCFSMATIWLKREDLPYAGPYSKTWNVSECGYPERGWKFSRHFGLPSKMAAAREHVERILENESLSLLAGNQQQRIPGAVPGPAAQGSIPHQTVQGERAALFRRRAKQPLQIRTAKELPSTSFTVARSYQNRTNTFRPTDRGRSRSSGASHVSQPYFRRTANTSRRADSKKEAKVPKDVFLLDTGVTIVPRGTKRAPLYDNKQVKSSLKIDPSWSEAEFIQKIEEEFASILDMGKAPPRYFILCCAHIHYLYFQVLIFLKFLI